MTMAISAPSSTITPVSDRRRDRLASALNRALSPGCRVLETSAESNTTWDAPSLPGARYVLWRAQQEGVDPKPLWEEAAAVHQRRRSEPQNRQLLQSPMPTWDDVDPAKWGDQVAQEAKLNPSPS